MACWVWGTARTCGEPYQETKEPGKPQESGFLPRKSESSARNVLEHCRDGGANCQLWSPAAHIITYVTEGIPVVLFDDWLTLVVHTHSVPHPQESKESSQYHFDIAAHLAELLWWNISIVMTRIWFLSHTIHPGLVTSDYGVHGLGVTVCGVQHVLWDFNIKLHHQQLRHKFSHPSLHCQIFSQNGMCRKSADVHLFCNLSDGHMTFLHHHSFHFDSDLVILASWRPARAAIAKPVVPLFNLCYAHNTITESHLNLPNGFPWLSSSFWQNLI